MFAVHCCAGCWLLQLLQLSSSSACQFRRCLYVVDIVVDVVVNGVVDVGADAAGTLGSRGRIGDFSPGISIWVWGSIKSRATWEWLRAGSIVLCVFCVVVYMFFVAACAATASRMKRRRPLPMKVAHSNCKTRLQNLPNNPYRPNPHKALCPQIQNHYKPARTDPLPLPVQFPR